jgi:Uma2 family endonuclease
MQEIVLVLQKRMQVEIYRRSTKWQREIFDRGARIKLEGIDFECTVDRVYRRLKM